MQKKLAPNENSGLRFRLVNDEVYLYYHASKYDGIFDAKVREIYAFRTTDGAVLTRKPI